MLVMGKVSYNFNSIFPPRPLPFATAPPHCIIIIIIIIINNNAWLLFSPPAPPPARPPIINPAYPSRAKHVNYGQREGQLQEDGSAKIFRSVRPLLLVRCICSVHNGSALQKSGILKKIFFLSQYSYA